MGPGFPAHLQLPSGTRAPCPASARGLGAWWLFERLAHQRVRPQTESLDFLNGLVEVERPHRDVHGI